VPWFTDPDFPHRGKFEVAIQASGAPASSLIEPLEEAGITVIPWKGPDLGKAHGSFYDLVVAATLYHLPQPVLDIAAATAVTRPLGEAWAWDRRNSPHDASPLVAATGAVWALSQYEPPREPPPAPVFIGKTEATSDSVYSLDF
jgi:hypothetical protein